MQFQGPVGLQGVFRGIGDTRTPFVATVTANALNILLDPVLIFLLGWGAPGAALATVASQASLSTSKCVNCRSSLALEKVVQAA